MGFEYIGTVQIFVKDQDRARKFYTDKLGLELRSDQPLFPGADSRWVSVAPKGAKTEIVLYKIDDNWKHYEKTVGESQALTINVSNLIDLLADLRKKDVKIIQEPDPQPWGTFAMIEDSEGNHLILVEPPKG